MNRFDCSMITRIVLTSSERRVRIVDGRALIDSWQLRVDCWSWNKIEYKAAACFFSSANCDLCSQVVTLLFHSYSPTIWVKITQQHSNTSFSSFSPCEQIYFAHTYKLGFLPQQGIIKEKRLHLLLSHNFALFLAKQVAAEWSRVEPVTCYCFTSVSASTENSPKDSWVKHRICVW